MSAFRRLVAPVLALLLALLVAGQATDTLPCADEPAATTHVDDATGHEGAYPSSDGAHDAHASAADCLCHLAYAPPAPAPGVGAPAEVAFAYPNAEPSAASAFATPAAPVPLG